MIINKLDNFGRGITYIDDKITFVKNTLPDEEITVDVIKDYPKFKEGIATSIENPNKNRIVPKCKYYETCGGCNIMHMNIDYQEEFKLNKVSEILKKYANVNNEVKLIKCDKDLFYRNKITLKVIDGLIGYFNEESHSLVNIDCCLIANNTINDFLKLNLIKINNGEIVIRSNYQNNLLISIYSEDKVEIDKDNIPNNVVGIVLNRNKIYGDDFIYDMIGNMRYKISFDSFFQVNNYVASCIFDILRNNLSGINLLDLYCGVGTLGLAVADNFKNIYGIEKIKNAILNAKDNASLNGIKNTHFYVGNTSDEILKLNVNFDTIIVDPPRSGLNNKTIEEIIRINPKTLCYVSCDPMTLARDLKILNDKYKVIKINALDMFPNTYHVETVCILERK